MCGICGVMSQRLSGHEEDCFKELMVYSQLRGPQGSGIIGVEMKVKKRTQQVHTFKSMYPSGTSIHTDDGKKMFERSNSILIGHARLPTAGKHSIENLHPHRHEHIIGVHNGTMYSVGNKGIPKDHSDSAMVFDHIANEGIESFVHNSSGAYALIWVDTKERTLNFIRNGQRPLYFLDIGTDRFIHTKYWASERIFLESMLMRNYKNFDVPKITMLPENMLLRWPLVVQNNVGMPDGRKIEKPLFTSTTWKGQDTGIKSEAPFRGAVTQKERNQRLASKFNEYRNKHGKPALPEASALLSEDNGINPGQFMAAQRALQAGCCNCGTVPNVGEKIVSLRALMGNDDFLCFDCSRMPEWKDFMDPGKVAASTVMH